VADVFRSLAEKPFDSDYLFVETVIDHPVERVWPHVVRFEAWATVAHSEPEKSEPRRSLVDGASHGRLRSRTRRSMTSAQSPPALHRQLGRPEKRPD